jgi:hypothetical protein
MLMVFSLLVSNPCLGGALDVFDGQQGTIKIAGGTAHIPVMKEAAKRIYEINMDRCEKQCESLNKRADFKNGLSFYSLGQ